MQPCSLKLPQTLSQVYNVWVWRYDIPLSNKPLFGKGWAVYCQNANIGQWWYYTIVFGTRSSSTGAALTLTLIENMKGDTPAKFPCAPPSVMISARAMLSAFRLTVCLSVESPSMCSSLPCHLSPASYPPAWAPSPPALLTWLRRRFPVQFRAIFMVKR